MNIEYVQATDDDFDYCENIHHEGMRPYCEPLWGWDENFQHERYRRLWMPNRIKLLVLDDSRIGYIETEANDNVIKLVNIFVNPILRKQGIGSKVINHLIDESRGKFSRITLNVLHNNPAKKLYEKLGFKFVIQKDQILVYQMDF